MRDLSGYWQVSGKHRIVARLPDGLSGKRALARHMSIENMTEREAGDHYLRVFGDVVQLTPVEWAEFRAAGGTTYATGGPVDDEDAACDVIKLVNSQREQLIALQRRVRELESLRARSMNTTEVRDGQGHRSECRGSPPATDRDA